MDDDLNEWRHFIPTKLAWYIKICFNYSTYYFNLSAFFINILIFIKKFLSRINREPL